MGAALALLAAPALAQQPPEQQSDEAMQGGGMTEERDLSDEQARLHFRAGRGLYDAGRFAQAAAGVRGGPSGSRSGRSCSSTPTWLSATRTTSRARCGAWAPTSSRPRTWPTA
ncbi:MAG: hypothetical protein M5U28_34065 [Sandaracinaceae bacterium]|nr:hypothetical protein [Sandaracinaceae bacterium]